MVQESDQNLQESEFIRKAMTTYYIWPLNNVVTYKLILQNYECPVCYVYIDLVDIKSKTVFPVMVNICFNFTRIITAGYLLFI